MDDGIAKTYGGKIRVRVCGVCWQNDLLLMVNHKGITASNFWAPPGGGLEFGESIEQCITREFLEETGLAISLSKFLFGCEFVQHPLHAVELFFHVSVTGGVLKNGYDPESQVALEVRFLSPSEFSEIPVKELHGIFNFVKSPGDLTTLNGFFRI